MLTPKQISPYFDSQGRYHIVSASGQRKELRPFVHNDHVFCRLWIEGAPTTVVYNLPADFCDSKILSVVPWHLLETRLERVVRKTANFVWVYGLARLRVTYRV